MLFYSDFQKYGTVNGTVISIAKDSADNKDFGEVYEVNIRPEETSIMVDGRETSLATGMTVSAEINVGKRRIIEFFIYPIIKYLDEGMSVR